MSTIKVQIEAQTTKGSLIEEYEVKRWLQGKAEGTKPTYLSALKAFTEHTGLSTKQLIDEADADRQKGHRHRGAPEDRILEFHSWLLTGYTLKIRGRSNRRQETTKKGSSKNLAHSYSMAICGFYRANGFPLSVKVPKGASKKENFKLTLRIPDIKKLLNSTTNLRDKSITLTLFQSGMSIRRAMQFGLWRCC